MATPLEIGTTAPSFNLPDQNGNTVSLEDFNGKWLVLYFYPKAMTPGCTTQACDIRDNGKLLEKYNAEIIGVSPDASKRLKKFEERDNLNFTLVGDEDHSVSESYGVWGEKKMYGKTFEGIFRVTYIIDPKGKVAAVFPKVKPAQHLSDVEQKLLELQK